VEETGYGSYMGGYDDMERKQAVYTATFDTVRRAITSEWSFFPA